MEIEANDSIFLLHKCEQEQKKIEGMAQKDLKVANCEVRRRNVGGGEGAGSLGGADGRGERRGVWRVRGGGAGHC